MSDYSAVAPPQSSNSNVAFAEALHRARLIAAKINPGSGEHTGQKRPLEDGPGSGMDWTEPEAKKPAGNINDYSSLRQPPNMAGTPGMRPGMGGVVTEDIRVPDKMVGLIIGRGGEQITRLQNEAGCKIQMASDSHGMNDRVCTITGTRDAITRARDMIMGIINQRGTKEGELPGFDAFESRGGGSSGSGGEGRGGGGGGHMGGGQNSVEMMVPGNKVGLVIGKGGETIKQLQEKSGAKLVIIQDGPETEMEKALRITGDPQTIEYAKQLVYDLISDKEQQFNRGGGGGGGFRGGPGGFGGGGGGDQTEVAVPKAAVGVVIGKGGDMIKKIQSETGARVQFHQGREDGPGDRRCILSGSPSQVAEAKQRIEELIDSVSQRRDNDGGRGRGKPGGRENGGPGDRNGFGNNWDRRGGGPGQMDKHEVTLSVPANKCGIIIGRGGETIKQINHQTGAHCELDRRPPPNPNEKLFIVKGSAEQIESAKRMMTDKIGITPTVVSGNAPPSTSYPVGGQQQQFNQGGWGGGYQQWQNSGQGDPNNGIQVNPQTGQPDYSMQWAEYYRSLGMGREAEMIEQQAKAQKEGLVFDQAMQPPAAQGMPPQQGTPQPVAANGQPDYSLQWAEYYRSIGKIKEAEAIETQMKAKEQGGPGQQPGGPPAGAPAGAQMPGGQAYQYSYPNYYGGQGQPPSGMPNQSYGGYPAYGGYGGQPQGPEN
ncbi:far upstream element-binding protein 3 isoform X3 [Neocloeon triangulifer]|uniref:far upstream element-binding protein 3 isoform X3 n=1 Tax=Neocloeon triangulifer TaxID=2078957 RepID=UPI00286F79FA|nr:far upstream element-binding protein 3 isoform X3 [Neocloeon triangulifer]